MRKAIIISGLSKYIYILLSFIITMILSRLLSPSDFGIVAIITVFINLFLMLGDFGIGAAVIQNNKIGVAQQNILFTYMNFLSLLISFLFYCLSFLIAHVYENKVYIDLGIILSIGLFFNISYIIPQSILSKKQEFLKIGVATIVAGLCSGLIGIILAYADYSYYSIAVQYTANSIFIYLFLIKSSDVKFELCKAKDLLNILKEIRSYSTYQLGFNLINYFARNLDNLLIGKLMSAATLGAYSIAYKLILMPVQYLTNIVTPVMHPVLSKNQQNSAFIYHQFIKVTQILSIIGFYISLICVINSEEIIYYVFGEQWNDSISIFEILSYSIGFQMIMSSSGSIFQASNNVKLLFKSGCLSALLIILAILIGVFYKDIELLVTLLTASYVINFIQTFILLICFGLKQKIIVFVKSIIGPIISWIILLNLFQNMYLESFFEENSHFTLIMTLSKVIIITLLYFFLTIITKDLQRTIQIIFPNKKLRLKNEKI